jgi:hypothetical protein
MGHRKRKPRKCRICKKSPVWRGGDVKEPGPFCKRCYHKHVWPQREAARRARAVAEPIGWIEPIDVFHEMLRDESIDWPEGPAIHQETVIDESIDDDQETEAEYDEIPF